MNLDDPFALKRKPGRPATGHTPVRRIRCGPLWDRLAALAAERDETMTTLVIRALEHEERRLLRERRREPWREGS